MRFNPKIRIFLVLSDIENQLDDDLWGIGLSIDRSVTSSVSAKDNPTPEYRPKLVITYGANQTDANAAIEEGIGNSLPGNQIKSNQQIYLVNEEGNHFLGSFDRATILNNQTWSFHYADNVGALIGMPSLFRVLNIWENHTLSYEEIVSQVESFINVTRY